MSQGKQREISKVCCRAGGGQQQSWSGEPQGGTGSKGMGSPGLGNTGGQQGREKLDVGLWMETAGLLCGGHWSSQSRS